MSPTVSCWAVNGTVNRRLRSAAVCLGRRAPALCAVPRKPTSYSAIPRVCGRPCRRGHARVNPSSYTVVPGATRRRSHAAPPCEPDITASRVKAAIAMGVSATPRMHAQRRPQRPWPRHAWAGADSARAVAPQHTGTTQPPRPPPVGEKGRPYAPAPASNNGRGSRNTSIDVHVHAGDVVTRTVRTVRE